MFVGNELGEVEAKYQPVKIAAAEAQWTNCQPCSFSAFQIGGGKNDETPSQIIEIPHLLSLLATNSCNGEVVGLNELQKRRRNEIRARQLHPECLHPVLVDAHDGLHRVADRCCSRLWGGWLLHRGTLAESKWFLRVSMWAVVTPFVMNTAGWMLTENGRQPWIVQGLMKTINANSPSVSSTDIWISLIVFVLIYIALGAADRGPDDCATARKGLSDEDDDEPSRRGRSRARPRPRR